MNAITKTTPLPALAAGIRAAHDAGRESAVKMAEHWLEAGRLLTEAKKQVPHGSWAGWLEANVGFSDRTARRYMQIATSGFKTATVADLEMRGTMEMLAKPHDVPEPAAPQLSPTAFDIAGKISSAIRRINTCS